MYGNKRYQLLQNGVTYVLSISTSGNSMTMAIENTTSGEGENSKTFTVNELQNIDRFFLFTQDINEIQDKLCRALDVQEVGVEENNREINLKFFMILGTDQEIVTLPIPKRRQVQSFRSKRDDPEALKREIERLKGEAEELRRQSESLREENNRLNRSSGVVERENMDRKDQINKLLDENERMKQENEELRNTNYELENRIYDLENQANPRHSVRQQPIYQEEEEFRPYQSVLPGTSLRGTAKVTRVKEPEHSERNRFTGPDPLKGSIIRGPGELNMISGNINCGKKRPEYHLIYKATEDGDRAEDFHRNCNKVNYTLVLVKTRDGYRFGGYTRRTWDGYNLLKKDNEAFVFSLDLGKVYNIINNEDAIGCYPEYGPSFMGCQIRIYDRALEKGGSTYLRQLNYDTQEDFELNMGKETFMISEIEVYAIDFK